MLTRHGTREIIATLLITSAVSFLLWYWGVAWLIVVPALLLVFVLQFFRDPERTPLEDGRVVVCPADGMVTDITELDEPEYIGGKSVRIGVFMNVLSVHVNRAPLSGVVEYVKYHPGKFLDVRDPRAFSDNEHMTIGIRSDDGSSKVTVKLISGLIARRIVCSLKVGDRVEKGNRIGMIKFGSRVEVYTVPGFVGENCVKIGDKVNAGQHILARLA